VDDVKKNPDLNFKTKAKSFTQQTLKRFPEINLFVIILFIWIVLTFSAPYWNSWGNIKAILMSFSIDGIVVIAMTITLIVGGIDLSVGSVLALTMIIAGKLFLMGVNPWIASIIALLCAGLIGVIIGFFITKVGLNSLIVTLAIMVITRGACYIIIKGSALSLSAFPKGFKFIGQGSIVGIPFVIIIFIVFVIISNFMLRKSSILRKVIYTGSNERAAIFSGINTARVKFAVAVLTSTLAGFAGILYMVKFAGAIGQFGTGVEITAIAAAIIGGASLKGGKGTITGSVIGVAFLSIVVGAMVMLNITAYWHDFVRGLILLIAVTLDHLRQRKSIM
jgi:ribose transport system permease protein